ncbi:MAG: hypothetical protein CM15mV8_2110 [Caudoviricetes sp.]|nr:MAG: hypothetical protein CM15mV8_2110 [Caudoviricetes sp.]
MNSTQSPYVERVTVNTKGSVVSGSDPYGYAQGDAGRGAKLDGANLALHHCIVLFYSMSAHSLHLIKLV